MDFIVRANTFADATGHATGSNINTCIKIKQLDFNIFSRVYEVSTIPVMDYGSGIWVLKTMTNLILFSVEIAPIYGSDSQTAAV